MTCAHPNRTATPARRRPAAGLESVVSSRPDPAWMNACSTVGEPVAVRHEWVIFHEPGAMLGATAQDDGAGPCEPDAIDVVRSSMDISAGSRLKAASSVLKRAASCEGGRPATADDDSDRDVGASRHATTSSPEPSSASLAWRSSRNRIAASECRPRGCGAPVRGAATPAAPRSTAAPRRAARRRARPRQSAGQERLEGCGSECARVPPRLGRRRSPGTPAAARGDLRAERVVVIREEQERRGRRPLLPHEEQGCLGRAQEERASRAPRRQLDLMVQGVRHAHGCRSDRGSAVHHERS